MTEWKKHRHTICYKGDGEWEWEFLIDGVVVKTAKSDDHAVLRMMMLQHLGSGLHEVPEDPGKLPEFLTLDLDPGDRVAYADRGFGLSTKLVPPTLVHPDGSAQILGDPAEYPESGHPFGRRLREPEEDEDL